MKLIKIYRLQSGRRVRIAEEAIEFLGWKEGDLIVELLDEKMKAVILIRREDYESLTKSRVKKRG